MDLMSQHRKTNQQREVEADHLKELSQKFITIPQWLVL